jgi:hypothetical protein
MRDSTSVGPPAGKRLMYLTGLFGPVVGGAGDARGDHRRGQRTARQQQRTTARQHELLQRELHTLHYA